MSELATLARPYARAVYQRAEASDAVQKWSELLAYLACVMQDDLMIAASRNPKVGKERFFELLTSVCQDGLDTEGQNLVRLLMQHDKLPLLPAISDLFEAYKAENEGYLDVAVRSAFAINKAAENRLSEQLAGMFKKKIHLQVEKDASLIGGVLIRAGDTIIDGSVRGQLQQLAKRL